MTDLDSPVIGHLLGYIEQIATPEEILSFTISADEQARIDALLSRNADDELTAEERIELDHYVQMERRVILMKAKARAELKHRP